jgi:hypothetical protein
MRTLSEDLSDLLFMVAPPLLLSQPLGEPRSPEMPRTYRAITRCATYSVDSSSVSTLLQRTTT